MTIEIGQQAPEFTLKNQHGEEISLASFRGRPVVVVFYPFAFTGVCTGELCEIRDNLEELNTAGAEIVAVSCDSHFTLRVFAEREGYEFNLLSDHWPHGATASAYGVFNDQVGAAIRGTFVIDAEGVVRWKIENGLPDARSMDDYRAALAAL
ncbi:MAG: peroxiredoxin [Aeromicrobium sp.]|uniref:peroxiredoxin n=1 Tax=Aeromicrobium sp. TaxID=1871063 RepID=UPI0039E63BE9